MAGISVHRVNLPPHEEEAVGIVALLNFARRPMSMAEIAEANGIRPCEARHCLSQLVSEDRIKTIIRAQDTLFTIV